MDLFTAADQPAGPTPDPNARSWDIELGSFQVNGAILNFQDRMVDPTLQLSVRDTRLELTGINNQPDTAMDISATMSLSSGGSVVYTGKLTALPALTTKGELELGQLQLAIAQSYLAPWVRLGLESGGLDLNATLLSGPDQPLELIGELDVRNFEISDPVKSQRLAAWQQMHMERF